MTRAATSSGQVVSAIDRVPPQDLDAEMALLGSMMMSRDAIAEVIPIIGRGEGRWFYLPVHQKIFEVLLDLYDNPGKAIDLIVVCDELRRMRQLEFVGGQEYLIQLAESFAEWANAEHYAKIVRDKGMLRDLIRCAHEISDHAFSAVEEPRVILDIAEKKIFEVTEARVSGAAIEIREEMRRLVALLESGEEAAGGIDTGFTQLNEYTGGFQRGDLIIIAGRPSMGKTALGLNIAQHLALERHIPVAFFSMEMSAAQIAQRLVCAYGRGIDPQKLRKRMLSENEINDLLLHVCPAFETAPLFIDDTPGMSAMELRSKARRLAMRHEIRAVFVDYLQLMHAPMAESRQVEISAISRGLKSLGRELNIPVIAMAQLNRMSEGRSDKKPLMSDLRESGAIEQDADVVLLIHREEYYKPEDETVKGIAELIIAKQRNGPTANLTLNFNRKLTRFSNFSNEPEPYRVAPEPVPF